MIDRVAVSWRRDRTKKDTRSVDLRTSATAPAGVPDEELVLLIARRQQDALGLLYDRYIRLVYAVALRITGDRETAEEVVQDVFQNVWQSAIGFQAARGNVANWLLGITRHRAIDVMRSKRERSRAREQALAPNVPFGSESDVEDEVTLRLQRATIREALGALPDTQRQAIELAYYGGLSRSEIASQLGEPLGTIKTRLRLGLLKLRDLVSAAEE